MENKICIECGKAEIKSKNLCKACYSKMRRQTPDGKASLKKYNETKGKEAQKRWLSKQPKKEKIPKQNVLCECGNKSLAKGMCIKCYHKKYIREKVAKTPICDYKPREKKIIDYTPIYEKVLQEVKHGNTIIAALNKLNLSSRTFYSNITPFQKKEINAFKAIYMVKPLKLFEVDDNIDIL